MNVWPVVERELRVQARQGATHWLRLPTALVLVIVAGLFAQGAEMGGDYGARLFRFAHLIMYWSIWLLVPIMTADCISRERREGTLGLLFLTPLREREVVVAKGIAHGLRALTLVLAAAPVLVIPILLGGVGWEQAVISMFWHGTALSLALGAGLLASAQNRVFHRSIVWAVVWAGMSYLALMMVLGTVVWAHLRSVGQPVRLWGVCMELAFDWSFFW